MQAPILTRFHSALSDAYGARPDSDYDVAVFLTNQIDFGIDSQKLAVIETDIFYDMGAVINSLPFQAGSYQARTGLMGELRREGRDL